MATIVTRASKGSTLTWTEGDANWTNLNTDKAETASPTFTGTPAAPTAAADTSTTQIATTAFVAGQISDTAYAASWDGVTGKAPSKNAVYDEIELRAPKASPTLTGTPLSTTAAFGTNTTQIATTEFVQRLAANYVSVKDTRTSGTQGGGWAAANTWAARPIQTEVSDVSGLCSLGSNQITLSAGTYIMRGWGSCLRGNGFKHRLRNVTAGTTLVVGGNGYSVSTDTTSCMGLISGLFTVAASQALEFQIYAALKDATTDSNGYGASMTTGEVEVYAELEFWRIA